MYTYEIKVYSHIFCTSDILTETVTFTGLQNFSYITYTARREEIVVSLSSIGCPGEHDVVASSTTSWSTGTTGRVMLRRREEEGGRGDKEREGGGEKEKEVMIRRGGGKEREGKRVRGCKGWTYHEGGYTLCRHMHTYMYMYMKTSV